MTKLRRVGTLLCPRWQHPRGHKDVPTLPRLPMIIGLLATSLLAGCSMAPKYVRPEAPVSTTYPAIYPAYPAGQITRNAIDIGWREFFLDPRLQALIASALDNNRDLRTSALRIEEARSLYNIQSADLLPTINASASSTRSRTPGSLTSSGKPSISQSYQASLPLSFELDFFGRVRSLNDAALAQYLATAEARQAAHISLVAEVAKAYLSERALAEQLALAQKTVAGRGSAYKLAQQRFDAGASSALDLRLSESLLQSARVSMATLMRQQAQAQNALTLLAGKPDTTLPAAPALSALTLVAELPAGLPSDLLTRRPDIRAAEQRLMSANANIGAARAAFFPRISLTASAGTSSNALSGLFDAGSSTWSFVPQLLMPIFDGGRNSANLKLSEVRKNLAITDYEKAIQVAFREVADALAARTAIDEQIEAQNAFLTTQAERLRLADLRLQNGVASSLDVLDAQRELFSAQQGLVQVRALRLTNAVDLYRALGGGWTEAGAPSAAEK